MRTAQRRIELLAARNVDRCGKATVLRIIGLERQIPDDFLITDEIVNDITPMNLLEHSCGLSGFRPEHFLPREMLDAVALSELPFRVDGREYLGSERVLYGALDGFQAKREVTAKLPAHVRLSGIYIGEWHKFAVREAELRYFDQNVPRTVSLKEQAR